MSILIPAVYWVAALIVISEALNKIERTGLFGIDPVLRDRLDRLRNAPTLGALLLNRFKCLGWRAVSMRDRAVALLRSGGWRGRLVDVMKVSGWVLLAAGAGGALVSPFLSAPVHGADVCTMTGFALLIVRTRVREALKP